MKILRVVRNVAALFILVMGLLASQPGVGRVQASERQCGYKPGASGCFFGFKNGSCHDSQCVKGAPCPNYGCVSGF